MNAAAEETTTTLRCPYCNHTSGLAVAVRGRLVVEWRCRDGRCGRSVRVVLDTVLL